MKKSTISIIIGLTIVFFWCVFFSWFSTRGGPKYPIDILAIGLGVIFFWIYFYIFIPLAIACVVFGIIGLKKDTKKYLSWIGIIVNLLAIMLFVSINCKRFNRECQIRRDQNPNYSSKRLNTNRIRGWRLECSAF